MNKTFKNPEFRSIVSKLFIMQFIFMILILALMSHELVDINKEISNKNMAMIGKILYAHPELEGEVVSIVTKAAAPEEVNKGRTILSKYGYREDISLFSQPILKDLYLRVGAKLALLILVFLIPLLLLIKWEYSRIYSKIMRVSRASERVIHGDFSIVLPEESEGDFALLNHQFNQMSNRVKSSLGHLKDDKTFLKNIISDISHQLKTPLSSLIMLNELMLNDRNMTDEVKNDFIFRSQSQLERIEWLTINLLKMARLEVGSIEFQIETMALVHPIEETLSTLDFKIREKNQNVVIKDHGLDVMFTGDKDWTTEALINIIKNSIEHTPQCGNIYISLSETPLFSRIIIRDEGEGIEKKDIPHIFKRFYKGSSPVKVESIGIGLALSKNIIEAQNGTISVKSQKGKGTEFTITFLKGVI